MYDKTDAPHTMGDWLSILLIYDTKLGIIQKPDVMDRHDFRFGILSMKLKRKVWSDPNIFWLLTNETVFSVQIFVAKIASVWPLSSVGSIMS